MSNTIYLSTSLYSGPVSQHPLYSTWKSIKDRCFNPKCKAYKRYGAICITMLKAWINDSAAFLEWIDNTLGNRPDGFSLDRINPHGDYEPSNLRWADRQTQNNNIRDPEELARKRSELRKGKPLSEAHRKKMSDAKKGKTLSEAHKQAISASQKGKQTGEKNPMFGRSGENHPNWGKKQKTKQCHHCGKEVSAGNYTRWHGLNCPVFKKETEQLWNAWYSEFITTQEKEKVS